MPTTNEALAFLMSQKHLTVAPSKAVNACGVSVSELEMAQNAQRIYWTCLLYTSASRLTAYRSLSRTTLTMSG